MIGCGLWDVHIPMAITDKEFFPRLEYVPVLKAAFSRMKTSACFCRTVGIWFVWKRLEKNDPTNISCDRLCTPNDSHAEIAIAAAGGVNGFVWKPCKIIGWITNMVDCWKAGVANTVWYNYREFLPLPSRNKLWLRHTGNNISYRAISAGLDINANLPQVGEGYGAWMQT